MTDIYRTIKKSGLPVAYGTFKSIQKPPYIIYMGNGQSRKLADNTVYHKGNKYRLELYFVYKDEQIESNIEDLLLSEGWLYDKSEDVFIESEKIYLIYYTIRRIKNVK